VGVGVGTDVGEGVGVSAGAGSGVEVAAAATKLTGAQAAENAANNTIVKAIIAKTTTDLFMVSS